MSTMDTETVREPGFEEEDGLDVREMLGIVLENWIWVVAALVLATVVGVYVAYTAPPVYSAQALVKVERPQSLFEDSMPLMAQPPQGSAEVEILKSRAVIGAAAEQLNLNIQAKPDHFGGLGAAMARRHTGDALADPPLEMLAGYAWGGEHISLDRLDVPASLIGVPLRLTATEDALYELATMQGEPILSGRVGEAASAQHAGGEIRLFVSQLVARPGTRFRVIHQPLGGVVSGLRGRLQVTETGQRSGVLNIQYNASSPAAAESQLDAITEAYLRQNVERQNQEARNTLSFLQEQLPELKEEVDAAQSKLSDYQEQEGSVDLSMEAQGLLGQVSDIEQKLSELELKESELLQQYKPEHPSIQSVRRSRAQLQEERRELEQQLKKLPKREARFLELSRDAEVANELYVQLLNRAQELEVTKAGTTGFVHIVDTAYAANHPISPNRKQILMLAVMVGLLLGIGLAFLRNALRLRIRDPDSIERKLGLPVYATVPHSREQSRLMTRRQSTDKLLALAQGDDPALEALRSLRTSLQFALMEVQSRVVCITSPTPAAGKSFVAANLAVLVGDLEKRVLLIDADMRRGHIHRQVGVERSPGLSDVIAGEIGLDQALHQLYDGRLNFLASGTIPPNPSELLLNQRFQSLLEDAGQAFDLVIIDTPPILSVTDAAIVAERAGTTFLVARYNHTGMHEIETAARRLVQNGTRPNGVVFNDYRQNVSSYAYGKYGYHAYSYKSG